MAEYQEKVLKNGLKLITATGSAVAVVSLWIKAGSRYESKQQLGYSHFLEHLICKNIMDINRSMDKNHIGAYINAITNRESIYFFIEASENHLDHILSILAKSIHNLNINNEFETEKKVIAQEIQIFKDSPSKVLAIQSLRKFFGDHPLAQEPLGYTETESVQNATPEKLMEYKNKLFIPKRSAVIVASNLRHNIVLDMVIKHFGLWQPMASQLAEKPVLYVSGLTTGENYLYIPSSKNQTLIMINFYTPSVSNLKDAAALEVAANYLGQGHTSFLGEKLREETGLVYNISSYNFKHTDAGRFQIYTSSSEPIKTTKIIFESLHDFLDQIAPTEIESTKERMINIFNRVNANPRKKMEFLGQGFILFNRLFKPVDYENLIKEVKYENVINVTKKYLNKNNALLSILGPKDIKDELDLNPS